MSGMGSNFQSLAKHLNKTPENPWFIHSCQNYFNMFDPPHLLKCVGNNLMKYSNLACTLQHGKILKAFTTMKKPLALRTVPKLTEKHLHPNGFSKMKVKYAT